MAGFECPLTQEDIGHELHRLLFGVKRSVRYHAKRRQFFERCHRLIKIFALIAGSAAFVSVVKDNKLLAVTCTLITTFFSALDMIIKFSENARIHTELAQEFVDLQQMIVAVDEAKSAVELQVILRGLMASRLKIETKEPPILRVLDTLCHNELLRAEGYDTKDYVQVNWYQRLMSQIVDINQSSLDKRSRLAA